MKLAETKTIEDLLEVSKEEIITNKDSLEKVTVNDNYRSFLRKNYNLDLKKDHVFYIIGKKEDTYHLVPMYYEAIRLMCTPSSNLSQRVWGINTKNQLVKEHDMLLCNKGTSEQHITHVIKTDNGWHREQDYMTGKVINSYEFKKGTKIVIFTENKREVDIIASNDGEVIISESGLKIDAIRHFVLGSKEIKYVDIAGYEDIKKFNLNCSSCHGEGEYEVSAGSHSFFKECEFCSSILTK
jgi:hypothetical protein